MTVRGGVELGVKIGCPPPLPSSPSSCHARVLQFGGSVTVLMSHRHIDCRAREEEKMCKATPRAAPLFLSRKAPAPVRSGLSSSSATSSQARRCLLDIQMMHKNRSASFGCRSWEVGVNPRRDAMRLKEGGGGGGGGGEEASPTARRRRRPGQCRPGAGMLHGRHSSYAPESGTRNPALPPALPPGSG